MAKGARSAPMKLTGKRVRATAMKLKRNSKLTLTRKEVAFTHGLRVRSRGTPSRVSSIAAGKTKADGVSASSPFPGFARPSEAEVVALHTSLAKLFGERRPPKTWRKKEILDTVVGTILSQNTTNTNSHRAFSQLMAKFKNWDAVRRASAPAVASAIKCGGLAPTKTCWIQHILRTVQKEQGKTSMKYMHKLSKEAVHADLERFTGIGKKTSAIINLFEVGHPDMAVDTHVFRYACQLGWAPSEKERNKHNRGVRHALRWPKVTRDTVYAHLDAIFPDRLKYSMHLILTDTTGGLPTVCDAYKSLGFDGKKTLTVDGEVLKHRA